MSDETPLTSAALNELAFLSDPHLSGDGRRGFCVRTTIETPEEGPPAYREQTCEVDLEAGGLRVVAAGPNGADHPRVSPDGRRLAFLAEREGHDRPQIQLLDLEHGGEARPLTSLAGGVRGFAWRPDGGALLALGSDVEPPPEGDAVVARIVDRLHSKQDGIPWPGVRDGPPSQAFLVALDGARPLRLTDFEVGVEDAAWSPNGRALWLAAAKDTRESDEWRATLWRLALDGDAPAGAVEAYLGPLLTPRSLAVSEDGATLAWLAPSEAEQLASPTGLWTASADGSPVLHTGEVEAVPSAGGDARYGRYPNDPVSWRGGWLVSVNRDGVAGPAWIAGDGRIEPLLGGQRVASAFAHAAGRTLAIVETPDRPGELVLIEADGGERTLTRENDDFVSRYRLVPGSEVRRAPRPASDPARGSDDGVPWWRLAPREPREDGALVIQVHGGPHTNAGYGFSFEYQLLASHGYTVVTLNPRGSSSYGLEHRISLLGRYGTIDADDVIAVVDAALDAHDRADAPVHLTGGSYGGFMTNWLVTRTERFRSAVTQRSICNWLSFYGTSDIGYRFAEREVEGNPWDDTERLWAQSPLAEVAKVTTPILILHADADHRCPVEQAQQWYVALARLDRAETRLVRFADEGHELSRSGRPDRRVRRLDEIVGWFEAHP